MRRARDRLVARREVGLLLVDEPRNLGDGRCYRVSADGGTPMPVAADRYTTEYFAAPAPDGDALAITARANAGSQWWRKGHSHLDESEIWIVQRLRRSAGRYQPGHQGRREGRVADVERRRQDAVLHVGSQRRAEHLERQSRRRPAAAQGADHVQRRPRAVAVDLERRQDDRLRARLRHLDGRHGRRIRRAKCRSRCAARRRRPASSTARSPIRFRSWRFRPTARRSRSRCAARFSPRRRRTAATPRA